MTWLMDVLKIWFWAASDKILRDKAFNITKYLKYHGYKRGLPSMIYEFADQKTPGSGIKNENISNKKLAEDLHKPIFKTFKKRKVHSHFMENIWGADLADMPLISKFSERIPFLLSYWCLWQTCMDYSLKRQKKELQLLIIFKKFYMNQTANQMKYGL